MQLNNFFLKTTFLLSMMVLFSFCTKDDGNDPDPAPNTNSDEFITVEYLDGPYKDSSIVCTGILIMEELLLEGSDHTYNYLKGLINGTSKQIGIYVEHEGTTTGAFTAFNEANLADEPLNGITIQPPLSINIPESDAKSANLKILENAEYYAGEIEGEFSLEGEGDCSISIKFRIKK